jgi:hypothetical protein
LLLPWATEIAGLPAAAFVALAMPLAAGRVAAMVAATVVPAGQATAAVAAAAVLGAAAMVDEQLLLDRGLKSRHRISLLGSIMEAEAGAGAVVLNREAGKTLAGGVAVGNTAAEVAAGSTAAGVLLSTPITTATEAAEAIIPGTEPAQLGPLALAVAVAAAVRAGTGSGTSSAVATNRSSRSGGTCK